MGTLLFFLAIVLLILSILALTLKYPGGRLHVPVGIVMAGVAVAFLGASMITVVGTKDIGVVTSFGRPTGRDLSNGIHVKAPWQAVHKLDGAIQVDEFNSHPDTGEHNCIEVRIGDGSTACASMTMRWRLDAKEASTVYQNYRSADINGKIRSSLVETQLRAVLNDVLGDYQPLANVNTATEEGQGNNSISASPNLDAFSQAVTQKMNERMAAANHGKSQVEIVQVTMSFLRLSDTTQTKINNFQAEVGQTRIAQQKKQTALAQAAANLALSKSVNNDPNVLISKCLDTLDEAVKSHYALPAGFSCFGPSNVAITASK